MPITLQRQVSRGQLVSNSVTHDRVGGCLLSPRNHYIRMELLEDLVGDARCYASTVLIRRLVASRIASHTLGQLWTGQQTTRAALSIGQ